MTRGCVLPVRRCSSFRLFIQRTRRTDLGIWARAGARRAMNRIEPTMYTGGGSESLQ